MLTVNDINWFQFFTSLLNTKQAAELSGISPKMLVIWRCKGIGPSFTCIQGRVYYYKKDLYAWLQQRACFTRYMML